MTAIWPYFTQNPSNYWRVSSKTLLTWPSKTTAQFIMHLEHIECSPEGFLITVQNIARPHFLNCESFKLV